MTTQDPQGVQRLWREAEHLARQRQPEPALRAYEGVLAIEPGHGMALVRAARLALMLGRYRAAQDYATRACRQPPRREEALLALTRVLRSLNEDRALLDCIVDSHWRGSKSAAWLTEMSTLASTAGDNVLARQMLDLAIRRDPGHAPARYFRGVVAMYFGDIDAAARDLEKSIARAPHFAQAHWVLSRLRRQTSTSHHVERIRTQLTAARRGGNDEVYLAFGLHNELHDLGRFDEAWQALEHGCRARRRQRPHDVAGAAAMYQRLVDTCDARFVQSAGPMDADMPFIPVFIVGMHRSGSTLLERLLAGHPQLVDGGESYAFTAAMRRAANYFNKGALDAEMVRRACELDHVAIGRDYLTANAWRAQGRSHLTEKLPSNFLNAGFIARALPRARILHMVRDPLDTCFSNLRMMFAGINAFSYDQRELAGWYAQYRDLMAHWHAVMPGRVLDVHYGALVSDTETTMRTVLDFCGLDWQPGMTSLDRDGAVATASSPQMRDGIARDRMAAWKPYERHLQPMITGLEQFLSPR